MEHQIFSTWINESYEVSSLSFSFYVYVALHIAKMLTLLSRYIQNCKIFENVWNRAESWTIPLIHQLAPGLCWGLQHWKQLAFHLNSEMLPDSSLIPSSSANKKHTTHHLASAFISLHVYKAWFHFPYYYLWQFRKHFWFPRFLR